MSDELCMICGQPLYKHDGGEKFCRMYATYRAPRPSSNEALLREALEAARIALARSRSAIQDAFGQADAEARDHMKSAAKYDAGVRAFNELRDHALAKIDAVLNTVDEPGE